MLNHLDKRPAAASPAPPGIASIADALREAARLAAVRDLLAEREQELRAWLGAKAASHTAAEGTAFNTGKATAGKTYRRMIVTLSGAVRAKTGNLDTVTTLAGLATDKTGKTLIFAFMADKIPAAAMLSTAAKAINEAAAALANCGCRLRALPAARTVGL